MNNLEKRIRNLENRVGRGNPKILLIYRTVLTKDDLNIDIRKPTQDEVDNVKARHPGPIYFFKVGR